MISYSHELDHIIATTSFMSRDLDNLQATKLLFSAGGRKIEFLDQIEKALSTSRYSMYL